MRRLLIHYRTLRELLEDYALYCQPGEVWLRDSAGDHEPRDLLQSLSSKHISALISGINSGGGQPKRITTRISGLFSSSEHDYELIWSPDRQGWGEPPSSGSRTVHYFLPRRFFADPPDISEGLLIALC